MLKRNGAEAKRGSSSRRLNEILSNRKLVAATLIITGVLVFLFLNYVMNVLIQIPIRYSSLIGPGGMIDGSGNPNLDEGLFHIKRAFEIYPEKWKTYLIFLLIAMFADLKILYNLYLNYSNLNSGQKGSERWATRAEIRKQYKAVPEKKKPYPGRGGIPVAREKDLIYIDDSPVNNLVIGMTRSGKGEMFVFPIADIYSRAEKKASLIFTDPKLELAAGSIPALTKRGYECHVLNLIDMEYSMGYNPLTMIIDYYKRGMKDASEELIRAFAFSIFNSDESVNKDPFWDTTATFLLSALILAHVEDCLKEDEELNRIKRQEYEARKSSAHLRGQEFTEEFVPTTENEKKINMYSIVKLFSTLAMYEIGEDKRLLDEYFNSRPEGNSARLMYAATGIAGDKTKGSIFATALSQLNNFVSSNLAKLTAESTLDLYDVGFGEKPVAIFIGLPDYDRSKDFIASIFVGQLVYALTRMATAAPTGKSYREVIFTLDEFGNLPKIKEMASYITALAGRNIRFNLILQSYSQLNSKYGENDAGTIIENCGNQIYILTNHNQTAESFSRLVGNETYINESRSGQRIAMDKSVTESADQRPLINPNELMRLKRGECIVKRAIKREDLRNRDIEAFPVGNFGKYRMKYRWQYLADDFDPTCVLYESPMMEDAANRINKARRKDDPEAPMMDPARTADVKMESTEHIDLVERSFDAGAIIREWQIMNAPMDRYFSEDELIMISSQYLGIDRESREQILSGEFTSKDTLDFAKTFLMRGTITKENYEHLIEYINGRVRELSRKGGKA